VDFDVIGQRLIKSFIFVRYRRRSESKLVEYISYLQVTRKPMNQLGGKCYIIFSLSLEYPGNQ
jgi:hypothetical protein